MIRPRNPQREGMEQGKEKNATCLLEWIKLYIFLTQDVGCTRVIRPWFGLTLLLSESA